MQIGWLFSEGEFKVSDYVNMYSVLNLVPFLQQKPLNFDFYAAEQVEVVIISAQAFFGAITTAATSHVADYSITE
ncbi:hypothetical protein AY606_08430 [Acinetobacter sp. SFB]|nr:hypothetical protein AY606_08430 [Acinetobacter sp. SFB]